MAVGDLFVEVMYSDMSRLRRPITDVGALPTEDVLFIITSVEVRANDPRKRRQLEGAWYRRVSDSATPDSAVGYSFDKYLFSREAVDGEVRYWLWGWDEKTLSYRIEGQDSDQSVFVNAPPVMPAGIIFTGALIPQADWNAAVVLFNEEMH